MVSVPVGNNQLQFNCNGKCDLLPIRRNASDAYQVRPSRSQPPKHWWKHFSPTSFFSGRPCRGRTISCDNVHRAHRCYPFLRLVYPCALCHNSSTWDARNQSKYLRIRELETDSLASDPCGVHRNRNALRLVSLLDTWDFHNTLSR